MTGIVLLARNTLHSKIPGGRDKHFLYKVGARIMKGELGMKNRQNLFFLRSVLKRSLHRSQGPEKYQCPWGL